MKMPSAPLIVLLSLIAMPAALAAPVRPSFDCAKAASQAEKAICASAPLARADAEIAALYRDRRQKLSPPTAALLSQDETEFLASRDSVFRGGVYEEPVKLLLEVLQARRRFLHNLRVPSGDGLAGTWTNVAGMVTVKPSTGDAFSIDVNAVEPVTARWVCSTQGTGRIVDGVLEIRIEDDGSTLRLSREGQSMKVKAAAPPNKTSWTPGYCGLNGSVEGSYFATSSEPK